jgi:hypothetical protein
VTALLWVAFGELDPARWGTALFPAETGGAGEIVLGSAGDTTAISAELEASGEAWQLRGDGLELTIAPTGEGALDRATGSLTLEDKAHDLDVPASRETLSDVGELDSLRLLAAWFDDDEALALSASRPRGARGQESDQIATSLVESGSARIVVDPRLSTTYTGDGAPSRAGVELWVTEPGEEPDTTTERPYRIAGETAGSGATWSEHDLHLAAYPLRCHSHGRDGAGVYLLGRPA